MRKTTFRLLLQYVVALGVESLGPLRPATVEADDIYWVGYQGCAAFESPDPASFFNGDNWYGYLPPCCRAECDPDCRAGCVTDCPDRAIFGSGYDPGCDQDFAQCGYPHTIAFGNWCAAAPTGCPNGISVPGGDATVDSLEMQNESWAFDFGSAGWHCTPSDSELKGSLTVRRLLVGNVDGSDASLTLLNGMVHNTLVTHIASGSASAGTVVLDGPDARWIVDGWIDLGWVGSGRVDVRNGAELTAGAALIGIRDNASGTLAITDGGLVTLQKLDVGYGHESTGGAIGTLRVSSPGSSLRVTDQGMAIGGISSGNAEVRRGGLIVVEHGVVRISGPASVPSSLLVTDPETTMSLGDALYVGTNGGIGQVHVANKGLLDTTDGIVVGEDGNGILLVDRGGSVGCDFAAIGNTSNGEGAVTVSGGRSSLAVSSALRVGYQGQGTLDVIGGASVSDDNCAIGELPGSDGNATVSGRESRWENTSNLTVGGEGIGVLSVSKGGHVSVGTTLEITPNGTVTVASGGTITVGDCSGLLKKRNNAIFVCPGGAFIADGAVNARVVYLTPR